MMPLIEKPHPYSYIELGDKNADACFLLAEIEGIG